MKRLMIRNVNKDLTLAVAIERSLDGDIGDDGQLETMNLAIESIRANFGELVEALIVAGALPYSFVKEAFCMNVEEVDYTRLIDAAGYSVRLADDNISIWLIKPDGEAVNWVEGGQSKPETRDYRKIYFNTDIDAYACLRKIEASHG